MEVNDLDQYILYRAVGDATPSHYDTIPGNVTEYHDENLKYDTRYTYAVQALTQCDQSKLSEEHSVVPGPYDIILADYYHQSLVKLTYDCNHLIELYDGLTPTDIAKINDRIFFTNLWDNSLNSMDQSGDIQSYSLDEAPVDFAPDTTNGYLYVLTRDNNSLFTFTLEGTNLGKVTLGLDIHFQTTCAYDPVLDCLWITDDSNHKIYRYDLSTDILNEIADDIGYPDEIIVDTINGGCLIAGLEGIIHINSDGTITQTMPNHYIYDFSRDNQTGRLYYSGFSTETDSWEIGYVKDDIRTVLNTSYSYIYKIKTIPESSGTGLVLIDGNYGEIIRLNAQGEEIGRRSSIYGVMGIVLQ